MSPLLDNALCQKFPLIFVDRNSSMTVTAMCWGFDVEDGWYPLIDVLCEELQRESNRDGAPQLVATQVKEKFGGLRFYAQCVTERQEAMIDFAEALSFRICEECGAPGTLNDRKGRWIATRCTSHTEQMSD